MGDDVGIAPVARLENSFWIIGLPDRSPPLKSHLKSSRPCFLGTIEVPRKHLIVTRKNAKGILLWRNAKRRLSIGWVAFVEGIGLPFRFVCPDLIPQAF